MGIKKLLEILDGIDQNDICFCHNDIWGDNIIRNENELFVIDFGDADWGFRNWDLAYFLLHNQSLENPAEIDYFLECYISYFDKDPAQFKEHLFAQLNLFVPYILIDSFLLRLSSSDIKKRHSKLDSNSE